MMRDIIDFAAVKPEHYAIHGRLENWARWLQVRRCGKSSPMFRMYRSTARAREYAASIDPPNAGQGADTQDAFKQLAEPHRHALAWCYVYRGAGLSATADKLQCTKQGLMDLVHAARGSLLEIQAQAGTI